MKDLIEQLKKKCLSIFLYQYKKYIDVLDLLIEQYNNTIHSSIKMTPFEVSREENENKVWRNLYPEFGGVALTPKFSIGDNVRITKKIIYLIKNSHKNGRKKCLEFQKFN